MFLPQWQPHNWGFSSLLSSFGIKYGCLLKSYPSKCCLAKGRGRNLLAGVEFVIRYQKSQLAEYQAGTSHMELVSAHAPKMILISQRLALGFFTQKKSLVSFTRTRVCCGLNSPNNAGKLFPD